MGNDFKRPLQLFSFCKGVWVKQILQTLGRRNNAVQNLNFLALIWRSKKAPSTSTSPNAHILPSRLHFGGWWVVGEKEEKFTHFRPSFYSLKGRNSIACSFECHLLVCILLFDAVMQNALCALALDRSSSAAVGRVELSWCHVNSEEGS